MEQLELPFTRTCDFCHNYKDTLKKYISNVRWFLEKECHRVYTDMNICDMCICNLSSNGSIDVVNDYSEINDINHDKAILIRV